MTKPCFPPFLSFSLKFCAYYATKKWVENAAKKNLGQLFVPRSQKLVRINMNRFFQMLHFSVGKQLSFLIQAMIAKKNCESRAW